MCINRQMRSGTHRDLYILVQNSLFWMHKNTDEGWDPYKHCNFGYKVTALNVQNHWWGMGPKETNNSGANHTVLHAQKDSWGLVPIETCDFGAKHAVLFAQIDRWGVGPTETSNSGGKHAVLHYWPYPVLIELNRAWVRALLALPSPYWAK